MFLIQWPADLCRKVFIYANSQIIISLKLSNHVLNNVLSLYFPEQTEETHAIFQSGLSSRLYFLGPTTPELHKSSKIKYIVCI
jgi:hypothetical protein